MGFKILKGSPEIWDGSPVEGTAFNRMYEKAKWVVWCCTCTNFSTASFGCVVSFPFLCFFFLMGAFYLNDGVGVKLKFYGKARLGLQLYFLLHEFALRFMNYIFIFPFGV